MFDLKGPQMQDNVKRHDPHFALELALKDIRFAQALAKEYGVGMTVSNSANRTFIITVLFNRFPFNWDLDARPD